MTLGELMMRRPERVAPVLHKHGVHLCAGCVITFSSTPEKAAAYHAVPDARAFLRDLQKALK